MISTTKLLTNKSIKNVLDRIDAVKHFEEDVFTAFKDICLDFNIEQFALAIFSGGKNITESFCVYDTYPEGWVQHYKNNQYYLHDPAFKALKKVAVPFEWDTKSFENLSSIQQKLLEESYDFGIKSGITIPLIPYATFHGFVTALNQTALHHDVLYTLSLLGNVCSNKIMSLQEKRNLIRRCD